jgi:histidine triad (HIT) family protein
MDCVFCEIVAGGIPSFKVYEDAAAFAFMDINPLTEGHVLVVPKRHSATLFDTDDAVLREVIVAAKKVAGAMKQALGLDSLNLLQANGRWAAQSVPHLHFHLIPRRENDDAGMDWVLVPGDKDALRRVSETLALSLR